MVFDIVNLSIFTLFTVTFTFFCLFYLTKKAPFGIGIYFILFPTYFICFFALFLAPIDISQGVNFCWSVSRNITNETVINGRFIEEILQGNNTSTGPFCQPPIYLIILW